MALPTIRLPEQWTATDNALDGRAIMITGVTGGLGRAAALACANAGATVVLSGRRLRPLEKLYDEVLALGRVEPAILPLDLAGASPADYDTVVDALEKGCGRLDGLVHAAAHFEDLTPLSMKRPDEWLMDIQVNLTAPFLLTQACMPMLQESGDSAVVFVLDDRERLARAHWNSYGVAKAGLERFVEILHEETESSSLRVHGLLPAPMRTALRRKAWYGEDSLELPMPDAAAAAVTWLLGSEAIGARGALLDLRPDDGSS